LLFYKRMTEGSIRKGFIIAVNMTMGFLAAYVFAMLCILLLGCRPLHAYWDSALPTYKEPYVCYDETVTLPVSIIISVVMDVIIVALPCFLVVGMQMQLTRKLQLVAIFSASLVVCTAGIFRLYHIFQTTVDSYDVTWGGYDCWLWTTIENHLALACSCAPALRIFFLKSKSAAYVGGSDENSVATIGGTVKKNRKGKNIQDFSGECGNRGRGTVKYDEYGQTINATTELTVLEREVNDCYFEDDKSVTRRDNGSMSSSQGFSKHGAATENSAKFEKAYWKSG